MISKISALQFWDVCKSYCIHLELVVLQRLGNLPKTLVLNIIFQRINLLSYEAVAAFCIKENK